jgi:trimethylamine:corrinoid methyltransferase-like protein
MAAWQDLPMGKAAGMLAAKQSDATSAGEEQLAFHGKIRVP